MQPRRIQLIAFLIIGCLTGTFSAVGQSAEDIMDSRARKMHETLKSPDRSVWEDYIQSNFSKKLLEVYDMPGHLEMFKRLHKDFSDSDLKSIRVKDDKVLMVIERKSDKHLVTLELSYAADENYKLNRLSIEAGEM